MRTGSASAGSNTAASRLSRMQNFDEQRAEARVINVEVVMVDVDRLVAVELKLPVDFLPVESQRPLLGHPDEDNSVLNLPLAPKIGGYVVTLFVPELVKGYALQLDKHAHGNVKELRQFACVTLADGTLPVNHVRDHTAGPKNGNQISLAKIPRFHKIAQGLDRSEEHTSELQSL